MKTGYTEETCSSTAVTALKDNLRLIIVSLGYNNVNTRNTEAMAMLDYGLNQYQSREIFKKNRVIK